MKHSRIPSPWLRVAAGLVAAFLALVSASPGRAGSTNFVVAGDDLQARIRDAGAGDIMVVQSGTYGANGAFAINKPLTFVRSGVEPVILNSPINIASTGTVTFARIDFGADIGISSGSNGVVRIHDGIGNNLDAAGGSLTLRRCTFAAVSLKGTRLEAMRLTNTLDLTLVGNGAPQPKVPAVLVQGRCDQVVRLSEGMNVTMGYYSMGLLYAFDSDITGVGVQVFNVLEKHRSGHPRYGGWWLGTYWERCTSRWWNSQFFWSGYGGLARERTVAAIFGWDSVTELNNCDVIIYGPGHPGQWPGYPHGVGLSGGKADIRNCFFHLEGHGGATRFMVYSAGNATQISDCAAAGFEWWTGSWPTWQGDSEAQGHANVGGAIYNGPTPMNPINCRWLMAKDTISFPTEGPQALRSFQVTLATNSPLLNAGSADPIDRNRDGTRNTIGSTGGPLYNPANATTDQPIAFWLNLMPRRIVKGAVNTIKLEGAAASGH